MKPKSIVLAQMARDGHGKKQERASMIDWCREQ